MTMSPSLLSAVQRAGQAVFEAHVALTDAADAQAALVSEALASKAFGQENDALFSDWKAVAQLAQAFGQVESQLRTLFATAAGLQGSALAAPAPAAKPAAQPVAKAEKNAEKKPAAKPAAKPVVKKAAPKAAKPAATKPAAAGSAPAAPAGAGGQVTLPGNNGKVLAYLYTVLSRDSYTLIPQARIADAAGIPKGSINLSIRQLRAMNLLEEGAKKHYKLL